MVRVLDKPTTRQIAYTSADLDDPGVFVIDADGSDERQLMLNDRVSESPAWWPDGSLIAFTRRGRIHVVGADAGGNSLPAGGPILPGRLTGPSSRSRTTVAYS